MSSALAHLLFPKEAETNPSWEVLDTETTDLELQREEAAVTQINVYRWCTGDSVYGEGGNEDE